MSLLIAAVVVFGFSHTIGKKLFYPASPRPLLLYIHVAVFSSWVLFYILQSALVRVRKVRLHQTLGWFGVGLGIAVVVLGVATAIELEQLKLDAAHPVADVLAPLFDMLAFSCFFGLAIWWRKKNEFHRRLIFIASCGLTSAAFGRFPSSILGPDWFYAGVDFLIALGVARDVMIDRRIHQVYLYALPALILSQSVVMCVTSLLS